MSSFKFFKYVLGVQYKRDRSSLVQWDMEMIILPIHLSNSPAVAPRNPCTTHSTPWIRVGNHRVKLVLRFLNLPLCFPSESSKADKMNLREQNYCPLLNGKRKLWDNVWLQSLTISWQLKHKHYHTGEVIWVNVTYMQKLFLLGHESSPNDRHYIPFYQGNTRAKTSSIFILHGKPKKIKRHSKINNNLVTEL